MNTLTHRVNSRELALDIAKQYCAEHNLPWEEPVNVRSGFFSFEIWTAANSRGGNVSMKIRKRDGVVEKAGISPM